MASAMNQVVGIGIGLYITAYVGVPAISELVNESAGLTGAVGTIAGTVLPILAILAIGSLFMKKK